jgi:homoserine kinase type II
MAVFTEVTLEQAQALSSRLNLGPVTELRGIKAGIENTNYFLTTARGEFVLTVFERLSFEQLPFYLRLMQHLAARGVPVPDPQADARGEILFELNGKPAAVVNKLAGAHELAPDVAHCGQVGVALARMHLAGQDFTLWQPNLRGLPWWVETVPIVLPYLDRAQGQLISSELEYQCHLAGSPDFASLPRGPIHADLFRDNVMFERHAEGDRLTGFFDFYFAGVDTFLFDIAVCLNDWCIDPASGRLDEARAEGFVHAYESVRPLTGAEHRLLPAMLRAGALRFWISRLWDFHLPREASMLKPHDPAHFERVLRERIGTPWHALSSQ